MRLIHMYRQLYPHNCFYFSNLFTTSFVFPSFPVTTSARAHTHTHTHTPHTQLITTQRTHTYSSTHNLLHTNPSPSLFSFLLSPCHLYVSFAACWKKLTCGVVRSLNLRIWAFSRRNGSTKVGVSGTLRMPAPDVT